MIIRLVTFWYLIGLLVFFTSATFFPDIYSTWDRAYHLWAKVNDVILLYAIITYPKNSKQYIHPLIIISVARVAWGIVGWITGMEANNNIAVGILFLILIFICSFITLKEMIMWHKRK